MISLHVQPELLARCIQGANRKKTLKNALNLCAVSSVFHAVINSEEFFKALAGLELPLPKLGCFKERWFDIRSRCLKKMEPVVYMPLEDESDICYGEKYSIHVFMHSLGYTLVASSLSKPGKKITGIVGFIILQVFPYGNDFLEVSIYDKCSLRLSRLRIENEEINAEVIAIDLFKGLWSRQPKVSMFFHDERFFLRSDENHIFSYDLILKKTEVLLTLPKSPLYGSFEGRFYSDAHKVHYIFTRTVKDEKPESHLATFTFSKI